MEQENQAWGTILIPSGAVLRRGKCYKKTRSKTRTGSPPKKLKKFTPTARHGHFCKS